MTRIATFAAVLAVSGAALNAEQRKKLDQLAAQSGRGMMGMRGDGTGGMEGMDHGGVSVPGPHQ